MPLFGVASQDETLQVQSLGQPNGNNEVIATTFVFSRHGNIVLALFVPLLFALVAIPMPPISFYGLTAAGNINLAVNAIIPTSMRPVENTEVRVRVNNVFAGTSVDGFLVFGVDGHVTLTFNASALNGNLEDPLTISNVPISWVANVQPQLQ